MIDSERYEMSQWNLCKTEASAVRLGITLHDAIYFIPRATSCLQNLYSVKAVKRHFLITSTKGATTSNY